MVGYTSTGFLLPLIKPLFYHKAISGFHKQQYGAWHLAFERRVTTISPHEICDEGYAFLNIKQSVPWIIKWCRICY